MLYTRIQPVFPGLTVSHSLRTAFVAMVLLLTACSSGNKGIACNGQRQSLEGQPLDNIQGFIVDRFTSFSVTLPDQKIESGALQSSNRELYIPSSVTQDGWLAQRISDRQFSIINSPQDQMITFNCPAPGER